MIVNEKQAIEERTPIKLLKPHEVAEVLNIGVSTVYLLTARGELSCIRIGRSVRVRPEDLEQFIESKAQGREAIDEW